MIIKNIAIYSAQILTEFLRDILYFPVWWYSRGFFKLAIALKNFLRDKQKSLALFIWLKNIFRPMYGQYDWQGMLISFIVRIFQIIIRSIAMLFWIVLALAALAFWIILPVLAVYEIIFQII